MRTPRSNEPPHPYQPVPTRGKVSWLAIASIVVGVALVAFAGTYFGLSQSAKSGLADLTYEVPSEVRAEWGVFTQDLGASVSRFETPTGLHAGSSIYPAAWVHPKYWNDPLWAGPVPFGAVNLPSGFIPVAAGSAAQVRGAGVDASRISIPAIGVSAAVTELAIIDLGDSRAYETPANVVGHIPETANPGEPARGWYFGHLWSLVRGEGSVFRDLPKIAQLIRHDPVDVIIENDDGEFLYRVTQTSVVHQDDLRLQDSDLSSITLVACVPILVYDHRVLVTAELIGMRG